MPTRFLRIQENIHPGTAHNHICTVDHHYFCALYIQWLTGLYPPICSVSSWVWRSSQQKHWGDIPNSTSVFSMCFYFACTQYITVCITGDMNYSTPCPHSMPLLPNVPYLEQILKLFFYIVGYLQMLLDDLILAFSFFLEISFKYYQGLSCHTILWNSRGNNVNDMYTYRIIGEPHRANHFEWLNLQIGEKDLKMRSLQHTDVWL